MELILYITENDDNTINKSLIETDRFSFNFKDRNSIESPILKLKLNEKPDSNYCEIVELNRKYFIRDIESENNNIWNLILECDVIETFKDDILNSKASITRNINKGDYQEISQEFEVKRNIDIYKSNVTLDKEKTMILSTISGV